MKLRAFSTLAVLPALCATLAACGARVPNAEGRPTAYEDPGSPGRVAGVGFESQDLVSMTDQMMRDMLKSPLLANQTRPPRVAIDAEYFENESSNRLNRNSVTDRLRVELNRAAQNSMIFVGRHYSDMVQKERAMKRAGQVDPGSKGGTTAPAGLDYRLGGRITSLDAVDTASGTASRYHQIVFEMVDLETGVIVWSGKYELKKSASEDIIYR